MRLRNLAIVSIIALAGCASPSGKDDTAGPPPATGSPSAKPSAGAMSPVTVTRTGGIAGMQDEYNVAPDGSLTGHTRTTPAIAKKLSSTQLSELSALVSGGALAEEAKKSPFGPKGCADGFRYTVTAGSSTVTGTDCGSLAKEAPAMWKVVELVQQAVPQ